MVLVCSVCGWERCSESAERGEEGEERSLCSSSNIGTGLSAVGAGQGRSGPAASTVPPQSLLTLFFVNSFTLIFVFSQRLQIFFHCCWRSIFKQSLIARRSDIVEKHSNLQT